MLASALPRPHVSPCRPRHLLRAPCPPSNAVWELHTGCRPYAGLTAGEVVQRVVVARARPAFPRHTPPAWRQLAAACWAQAPQDRPSFEQVRVCMCDGTGFKAGWRGPVGCS